jgi:hypothetical protein
METGPLVWIIDAQQWPRAYLRAELVERGFNAVGHPDLSEAVAVLRSRSVSWPAVIVLELRDQATERELLDVLMRTRIPVVLLVGAVEANEQLIKEYTWAAVMNRPFSIGSVADKVEELISH